MYVNTVSEVNKDAATCTDPGGNTEAPDIIARHMGLYKL